MTDIYYRMTTYKDILAVIISEFENYIYKNSYIAIKMNAIVNSLIYSIVVKY